MFSAMFVFCIFYVFLKVFGTSAKSALIYFLNIALLATQISLDSFSLQLPLIVIFGPCGKGYFIF